MFNRAFFVAVVAGALAGGAYASCVNSCSGHGYCGSHDRCTCYASWEGTDCSLRSCPKGIAFADGANGANTHDYAVCSGKGVCDHATGDCVCSAGYTGYACARTVCPNDCSGHGRCATLNSISDADYQSWDGASNRGCVCDGYYTGADCSMRQCPRGDDPLTVEVECSGTSSGNQEAEVQEITVYANKMLSGEMTLTYSDAYGQSWTTSPIEVGGDNRFDVRVSETTTVQCGLSYASADVIGSTSGDAATTFAGTKFSGGSASGCSENTAAQFDTLVSKNEALRNVVVSKSNDLASGAKYEVSIGDLNFQRPSGGEIGAFSLASGATAGVTGTVHSLGDHSVAIQDALQSLPYNVIPSVTVSKVAVDVSGSDDVSASTTAGNIYKQKYRVTFSDAANSGDQDMLTCNAAGCNEDGCAPRYEGVVHERHLTTKSGARPLDASTGVTDARSTIVATGQGSFVLGHWHLETDTDVAGAGVVRVDDTPYTFTAGTYTLTWDYGSGNTDSASFAYNADASTIQTALRTITGWEGVTVTCACYASGASTTCTSSLLAKSSRSCTVTYAVGFDDGGKLPTMTYDNIQTSGNQNEAANARHTTDNTGQLTIAGEIGLLASATTAGFFRPEDKSKWVYIECTGGTSYSGYYEVIEADVNAGANNAVTAVRLHMPGKADSSSNLCTGVTTWRVTPLMPKFPSFSNTIALHDSTFVIQWIGDATNYDPAGTATDHVVEVGYKFGSGLSASTSVKASTTCAAIMTAINTNTPWSYGTSYCDCERQSTPSAPYIAETRIRCPGWAAFDLHLAKVTNVNGGTDWPDAGTNGLWPRGFHHRYANPRRMEHLFAVGDTITVQAGGSNLNRQFTVQSYVSDNLFGDGRYGTHPMRSTGATSDYADSLMYAKVTPAPVADMAATHLVARGQNSTVFTRVIEDASTSTQEVAKLCIHDTPATGLPARSENMIGTFQLSYDGESTRAIQTTATGADVMEFLAELSTLERVPAVTAEHQTIDDSGDQWAYVTCTPDATNYCFRKVFTFTFDGQLGDMEKLKFVYTGANNDGTLIISSQTGGATALAAVDPALPPVYFEYTSSGATLMDHIVEGYVAGSAANKVPAGTHDEIAMDVPVGSTINVSSSEDITFYLVDSAGTLAANNAEAATCATAVADGPQLTFEYQGAFAAVAFCSAATTYQTEAGLQTSVRTLSGLETTTVVCRGDAAVASGDWTDSDTTVDTDFNSQFASVAGYKAFAACTFTLPLGADGGAFFIHPTQHAGSNSWGSATAQTFVHRARNNNGRTFTVTKSYENKVSDLRSMGRVSAGSQTADYSVHAVYGDVTAGLSATACTAGSGTPGIYYDISVGTVQAGGTNANEVTPTVTVEIACAASSADCSNTEITSVVVSGYNALVTPAAAYRLGAALETASGCQGSHTLTFTTARDGLTPSLHTNTRKNHKGAWGTGGAATACADAINQVVPYVAVTNAGTTPGNYADALVHIKCESSVIAIVAAAAPGLFASFNADNRLNAATGTVITTTFADGDRPETGGTPAARGADIDDLISQTVNIFSFDCTSDNRFNIDPLFDRSRNGMDKILIMGGRDAISDHYGSANARDLTFFNVGGSNEAIYSSAFNYGRTQAGTDNNAQSAAAAKNSMCSIATTENKDTGVAGGGASGATGDERFEVAQPHAYIGRGKDTLWLTPTPDAMTGKKIHMTVTTPASGCSVTEVTKGSHESSVCSGRGNCDYATGTCSCDAGYTLEACSEQTVLV